MNRAFTFSNPKIIEKLKSDFVCFAGNTAELQPAFTKSPVYGSSWFMKVASQVPWKVQGNTTQGMYVAGPDGTAFGWKNKPGISDTLRFLAKGLNEFKNHPAEKVDVSKLELDGTYTQKPPPQTSIVTVYSRVCPVPEGMDSRNFNIGRDYLWIYHEEVHEILESTSLPQAFVARLCRFALVDAIRGEPDYWDVADIRKAKFTLEKMGTQEGLPTFVFKGDFMFYELNSGRGIRGHIDGEFSIDESTRKFVKFRAYAPTEAFGSALNATRGTPKRVFPLVFAFVDSNNDPLAQEVPPSALTRKMDYTDPKFPPAAK